MFYYTTPTTIDPYSHPLSLHDSLPISLLRRHAPGPKLNILMHDDTKRPDGPHAQGRLDIEVTRDELIPCSCTALLRSEEHTSELQSLMRISYDVFCLEKKKNAYTQTQQATAYNCTQIHY